MAYDPNRVHSDVASCLDEIARAVKGEEVRGSIYDAIELIDARSVQLETDARATMQTTANEIMTAYCPRFILYEQDNTGICNTRADEIYRAITEKTPVMPYIYISLSPSTAEQNTFTRIYSITSHISRIQNKPVINSYEVSSDASELICYAITFDSNISNTVTWTKTTVSISGGGGSYTEGDGIDITNDEISVKLRSSNPGLAFDSNGNLYATGSGGSYSGSECISVYNNVISLLYGDGLTVEYNSIFDIYELVPDYTYVQQKLDAGYAIAIRPGTGASTNPEISVLPGAFMPYYDINQGSGLTIVSNANDSMSLEVDFTTVQAKLTAGTGISIQNGVISLDLPQAEGGGF